MGEQVDTRPRKTRKTWMFNWIDGESLLTDKNVPSFCDTCRERFVEDENLQRRLRFAKVRYGAHAPETLLNDAYLEWHLAGHELPIERKVQPMTDPRERQIHEQIHDESQRMVGRTRAGRDYHVAYTHTEYSASTFPHRRLDELRAACVRDYLLTNDVQKYTDLPAGKLNLCHLCFGMVGQRADLPH